MTGGSYTALHPDRTPVSGKERVSLSRKTVGFRHLGNRQETSAILTMIRQAQLHEL